MNGTDTANVLPCGMGNAGFWRYGNYFPTAMGSSLPHGRTPDFALTAAECMETQPKSFVADGAQCHHFRQGFAQTWANHGRSPEMSGLPSLSSSPCSLIFSRDHSCITVNSSGWFFWRCSINVSPLMSCQALCPGVQLAFGFLPPSGGLEKWRDKHKKPLNHLCQELSL